MTTLENQGAALSEGKNDAVPQNTQRIVSAESTRRSASDRIGNHFPWLLLVFWGLVLLTSIVYHSFR